MSEEEINELEVQKELLHALLLKQLKQLIKHEKTLQHEWEKCTHWEVVQHEGELLKAHFGSLKKGLSSITVWDWITEKECTLALDSTLTPQESIALRFRRSKKMQRGLPLLEKQLEKAAVKRKAAEGNLAALEAIKTTEELAAYTKKFAPPKPNVRAKAVIPAAARPYHEYESKAGIKIWVGKSARNNEILTFQLARGSDWWLHAHGYAGSHVVIRTGRDQEPDPETIQDALQLALFYSKAKDHGEAEVCVTQRKFVTRFGKNHVGKVQVSKHKLLFARFNSERFKEIRRVTSNECIFFLFKYISFANRFKQHTQQ